jgi:AraC-like DNA-binding protein
VDAVTAMLDGHTARGAFLLRCVLDAPWSILVRDRSAVSLTVVAAGSAWLVRGGDEVAVGTGDVLLVKGAEPFVLADDPATRPVVAIEPGQECRSLTGADLSLTRFLGTRTWGNAAPGSPGDTVLLTGVYERDSQVTGQLLTAMPPVVVLRAGQWHSPLLDLLRVEMTREAPGQDAVLDRLVDLLLVSALREWFARAEAAAPPWWRARHDPVIGRALDLMHSHPERPWSVEALAREVAVSRATFARRFGELVGTPPMAYLTGWRLALAADLLRGTDRTLASVAAEVGYTNPFALSVAFKRRFGTSPQGYRRSPPAVAAGGPS